MPSSGEARGAAGQAGALARRSSGRIYFIHPGGAERHRLLALIEGVSFAANAGQRDGERR
jgi:hypothetical protein